MSRCTATLLAISTSLGIASAASAMNINVQFDASITSLTNAAVVEASFSTVAGDYARQFTNPVTINVAVSWGAVNGQPLPASAVGASSDNLYGYYSYAQMSSFLRASATSNPANTVLNAAVKSLPATVAAGPSRYVVASAEAKALGLIGANASGIDGSIGFAGTPASYSFNPTGSIAMGTYDFAAVAAHELDEVLGRFSGVDNGGFRTALDLFRYSSLGVLGFAGNAASYFSIDGGKTALGNFNYSPAGGDRGDWATSSGTTDIQDAFITPGQRKNLLAVDLTALDVLGYGGRNLGGTGVANPKAIAFNLVTAPSAVPEPGSWVLLVAGFGLTGVAARAARRAPALRG